MAKTVDQFNTLEQFRQRYNELATDVGDASGLITDKKTTIVDAINSIEEKVFFFQEFIFEATSGQTNFTGNDIKGDSLRFRRDKIQVFLDTDLLLEDDDYIVATADGNALTEIQLIGAYSGGATAGQKLSVFSFTGSFIGTEIAESVVGYFTENAVETIYNTNDTGVILNPNSSQITTVLSDPTGDGSYEIEAAGNLYVQDNLLVENDLILRGNLLDTNGDEITLGDIIGGEGINANTVNGDTTVSLDYEIVSTAPTDAGSTSTGHLWFVVTA